MSHVWTNWAKRWGNLSKISSDHIYAYYPHPARSSLGQWWHLHLIRRESSTLLRSEMLLLRWSWWQLWWWWQRWWWCCCAVPCRERPRGQLGHPHLQLVLHGQHENTPTHPQVSLQFSFHQQNWEVQVLANNLLVGFGQHIAKLKRMIFKIKWDERWYGGAGDVHHPSLQCNYLKPGKSDGISRMIIWHYHTYCV